MGKVLIETKDIRRGFPVGGGDMFWAVRNMNITVNEHKLTILKGRSGSGKTTLMNLLGALDYPTSGKIMFGDTSITEISDKKRNDLRSRQMGFVFQSVALIGMMSAYENVEFILRLSKSSFSPKERRKRAITCLEKVGLGGRMHHMPAELSGGEQQRVAIARAIAHNPKIIFADEPTSQLDTNTSLQVVKIFRDLVEEEGATIVMTTHDPGLMDLADKVYEMEDGAIVG